MKQILIWLLLALATLNHATTQATTHDAGAQASAELVPAPQEAQAARLASELLTRFHYNRGVALDEVMSAKIFDQYLKSLDAERLLFVQADIDRMSAFRNKLGEAILKKELGVPFAMFNLYRQRANERFSNARALLKTGFDFEKNESYQFARRRAAPLCPHAPPARSPRR